MRFRLPIAAAVALLGTAVPAAAAEFTIDPEHTTAVFMVNHLGYMNMIGRFNEVSGSFTFDENAPDAASVTLKVATDSVDSSDAHMSHLQTVMRITDAVDCLT